MAKLLQEYFKIEQADTIVPAVRKLSLDFAKAIDDTNQIAECKKDKYYKVSTAKALVQSVLEDLTQLKEFMVLKQEDTPEQAPPTSAKHGRESAKPHALQSFSKKMRARKRGRPRKI